MQSVMQMVFFVAGAKLSATLLQQFARRRQISQFCTTATGGAPVIEVADLRKDYSKQGINDGDALLVDNPFPFFKKWFEEACTANVIEPNAMFLATCSGNIPTARVVLMKGFDEKGIVWFTNYKSRKGKDLDLNPVAAATFWWAELERSVRIEGRVEKTSDQESDAYFNSRPRGSQIGAWSSNQSHEIGSRAELDEQERLVKERFSDESKPVPRPPHWGGFRLVPNRIEFWKGRSSRMHDRIVYERDTAEVADKSWRMVRLQP